MKIIPQFIFVLLLVGFAQLSFSQKGNAVIYKNYNVQAAGLVHKLNRTKDTLILKSNKNIRYLYTANHEGDDGVRVRIDNKNYKLPLNKLKKGRNVMVVIQSPLKIVFVINILKEFEKPVTNLLTAAVD